MIRNKNVLGLLMLTIALVLSACTGSLLNGDADVQPANSPVEDMAVTVDTIETTTDTAVTDNLATAVEPPALAETTTTTDNVVAADVPPVTGGIVAQQQAFIDLYNQVNPSAVSIQLRNSQGSGFVYREDGYIITNNHVIEPGGPIVVIFADGSEKEATLVGAAPDSDLAVLKVDAAPGELTALPLADSDALQVGQLVIAIGNPFGQANSMTTGIISALGRLLPTNLANGGYNIPAMIQTDAAINPGNSGGPLLDINGRVIGVNSAILSPVQGSSGVGYAIPANLVSVVAPQLIENGRVQTPWLGISGVELNSSLVDEFNLAEGLRGVLIGDVAAGGPAAVAGLRGSTNTQAGDVIVGVDGRDVRDFDDLLAYVVQNTAVGQTITLDIIRDGQPANVSLTLQARPS